MILGLDWWVIALAVIVAIIGSARLTRLITHDAFPPVAWLRAKYEDRVPEDWSLLVHCPWCMGPWMFLVCMTWFVVSIFVPWLAWPWWLFYIWMAGSYLTSQYVHFDEGRGE